MIFKVTKLNYICYISVINKINYIFQGTIFEQLAIQCSFNYFSNLNNDCSECRYIEGLYAYHTKIHIKGE